MARRPARLERAGALTPRDRMWAAIRQLAQPSALAVEQWFSPAEVMFLTGLLSDTVDSYFRGLTSAQPPYLQRMLSDRSVPGRKRTELHLYRLARDVGVDAPRVTKDGRPVTQGLGNELMWSAMKALKAFDHAELAMAVAAAASDSAIVVSEETAKTYCTFLCRAGYLVLAAPNNGPYSKARYRFVRAMNSGPRSPLITKHKEVIDGNTGAIRWSPATTKGQKWKGKT